MGAFGDRDLDDLASAHVETHEAWEINAAYWDDGIGEGNDFVNHLIWPATERMLTVAPGERVLDAACGNGLYARRLVALGAEVVAFDFSAALIERARARDQGSITYRVLDATNEAALLSLGPRSFDAAICQMALFDISDIRPLMQALSQLLKPGGRFIFSLMHPCFNNPSTTHTAEQEDREGKIVTTYAMKVYGYLSSVARRGAVGRGQPKAHVYFHRSLQTLLGICFEVGFVMDALEEPGFSPDHPSGHNGLSWGGHFSEIPPVLMARMRLT
ncbi:MAG: methyltransferase domain-containing protein [Anaerolineae bacterium]|nr:methyltransferase domain-containing protein [Anaerolineae bacterium]